MTAYEPPIGEVGFLLDHVAGIGDLRGLPGLEGVSPDLVASILGEAGRFAAQELAPLNQVGDRQGAVLEKGEVRTAPGFKEAYQKLAEAGWMGLPFPEAWGGQDLPWLLNTAVGEFWNSASMTFELSPLLTRAAAEAVLHHGTEAQKAVYLEKLVTGAWAGAMGLTEPQAGTDLGAIRTRAERHGDHYRLFGQKIYTTYGDHDLTPNIVHMVLARLPDAPEGTKGVSLFLVPKFLPDATGAPGRRNDVRAVKLEEKLGIHGSPTCVMAYGDEDGAVAELVGEEHGGVRCVFTMMNNARLAVGLEALGIAERAYQGALAYARERRQGRYKGRPAAILEHPELRRSLVAMRARIAAMRALCLWAQRFVDIAQRHPDEAERTAAADRVALLTPVVKAWCSDLGCAIASDALQVFGGMGFIEETGAAQHYRDVRITPIYEGTNGIQALDLVGRKLSIHEGRLPQRLFAELEAELGTLDPADAKFLAPALHNLVATTRHLQAMEVEDRGVGARPYLELMGWTLGGFLLTRAARAAADDPRGAAFPGLARFYLKRLMPQAIALHHAIHAEPEEIAPELL